MSMKLRSTWTRLSSKLLWHRSLDKKEARTWRSQPLKKINLRILTVSLRESWLFFVFQYPPNDIFRNGLAWRIFMLWFFFVWCDAGFSGPYSDNRLATSWLLSFSDFNHVHLDPIGVFGLGEEVASSARSRSYLIAGLKIACDDDMYGLNILKGTKARPS